VHGALLDPYARLTEKKAPEVHDRFQAEPGDARRDQSSDHSQMVDRDTFRYYEPPKTELSYGARPGSSSRPSSALLQRRDGELLPGRGSQLAPNKREPLAVVVGVGLNPDRFDDPILKRRREFLVGNEGGIDVRR
jgi:hypothetical protein